MKSSEQIYGLISDTEDRKLSEVTVKKSTFTNRHHFGSIRIFSYIRHRAVSDSLRYNSMLRVAKRWLLSDYHCIPRISWELIIPFMGVKYTMLLKSSLRHSVGYATMLLTLPVCSALELYGVLINRPFFHCRVSVHSSSILMPKMDPSSTNFHMADVMRPHIHLRKVYLSSFLWSFV